MDIDAVHRAYMECALWYSNNNFEDPEGHGHPLDRDYGPEDIEHDTRLAMREDCADFVKANEADLAVFCERLHYDEGRVGFDFWLNRNGHGSGFWDEYFGKDDELRAVCQRLSEAAKAWGDYNIEATGTGKVAVM